MNNCYCFKRERTERQNEQLLLLLNIKNSIQNIINPARQMSEKAVKIIKYKAITKTAHHNFHSCIIKLLQVH